MHLADLLRLRARPLAGLLLALTARCPLACAHCSTDSAMTSPQYGPEPFRHIVSSFTPESRPEAILMSGGEPLLRPDLVVELATMSKAAGTAACLLSGMYFARSRTIPHRILRAVSELNHFAVSIDRYHEREVGRDAVLRSLHRIRDLVPHISVHVTAASADDVYVDDLIVSVRRSLGDGVPILVGHVHPTGRGVNIARRRPEPADTGPCEFANWPLIDYDGAIFGCSRQSLVRQHRPAHLVFGTAASTTWAQLVEACSAHPTLRAVRTCGPVQAARTAGSVLGDSACSTCMRLTDAPPPSRSMERATIELMAAYPPRAIAGRWGAGRYGELVEAGWAP